MGKSNAGNGVEIDPLIGMDDSTKPLRSKLLAVPSLRARYLEHVKTIADVWLDWKKLQPIVAQHAKLIEKEVDVDGRKLSTTAMFKKALGTTNDTGLTTGQPLMSLGSFAQQRRKFLLSSPEIKKLAPAKSK